MNTIHNYRHNRKTQTTTFYTTLSKTEVTIINEKQKLYLSTQRCFSVLIEPKQTLQPIDITFLEEESGQKLEQEEISDINKVIKNLWERNL